MTRCFVSISVMPTPWDIQIVVRFPSGGKIAEAIKCCDPR